MKLNENKDRLSQANSLHEAYTMLQQPKTDSLSDLEKEEFAAAEAAIQKGLKVANGYMDAAEKEAIEIERNYPGVRLPQIGEVLEISSFHTLDKFIDQSEGGGFCQLTVSRLKDNSQYCDVIIRKICNGYDYGYEIYNERGVRIDSVPDLVLFYRSEFPFNRIASLKLKARHFAPK